MGGWGGAGPASLHFSIQPQRVVWFLLQELCLFICLLLKYFWWWTISEVFIEFGTILLLFYALGWWFFVCLFVFGPEAWKILAPWPRIKPTPPSLEGRVPTSGPLGKFQDPCLIRGAQLVLDGPGLPSKLFQKSFIINKKTCHDF